MSVQDYASMILVGVGLFFFLAGTVGLLRFPDVFTRLHALTKADNLGLGLILAGLAVKSGSPVVMVKMAFVWVATMLGSSAAGYLVARRALRNGMVPWRKP